MSLLTWLFGEPAPAPVQVPNAPRRDVPLTGRVELMVTLWPSFPHFRSFVDDGRVQGVRLNPAMINLPQLDEELGILKRVGGASTRPRILNDICFDVKSRQLRVEEVLPNPRYLDLRLNHSIRVKTPVEILLKAGADHGRVGEVSEGGRRLTFDLNPHYSVRAGESIHIRDPHEVILPHRQSIFTDLEVSKIEKCKKFGFRRWFLSYVECQDDVDAMRELVGPDAELLLKIESQAGLRYVRHDFKPDAKTRLVAAFGDLYVEVEKPHDILAAAKLIISKDPRAIAGSRMMLSVVQGPVPSFADWTQLSWLYEIGYRNFMLCDEICLDGELLDVAVNAFEAWRQAYVLDRGIDE